MSHVQNILIASIMLSIVSLGLIRAGKLLAALDPRIPRQ